MAESNHVGEQSPASNKMQKNITSNKPNQRSQKVKRGLMILIFSIFVVHLCLNVWSSVILNQEFTHLRDQHEPLVITDLAASKPIPDAENAAPIYVKAYDLLSQSDINTLDKLMDSDNVDGTKSIETCETLIKNNGPAIKIIKQAAALPGCRFLVYDQQNLVEIKLPHLRIMRLLTSLMHISALLEARHNHTTQALDDVNVIFRISDHVSDEPFMISSLFTIYCEKTGYRTLLTVLKNSKISKQQADRVYDALPHADWTRGGMHAFQCERIFGIWIYQHLQTKPWALFELDASLNGQPNGSGANLLQRFCGYILYTIGAPIFKMDEVFYLRMLNKTVESAKTIPHDSSYMAQYEHAMQMMPWYALISRTVTPALGRYIMFRDDIVETRSLAQAALAINVYHTEKKRYPSNLKDASSISEIEIPNDIYSNVSLHYKVDGDNYVLYSVGANRRDDGGKIEYKGMQSDDGDLVWSNEEVKPRKLED